jgi:hypothetical protein
MIRIWNYNKNRIHSYRGARYLEISLDNTPIFKGEVKRAPGGVLTPEDCSECILFTTSDMILSLVEKYDPIGSGVDSSASTASLAAVGGSGFGSVGREGRARSYRYGRAPSLSPTRRGGGGGGDTGGREALGREAEEMMMMSRQAMPMSHFSESGLDRVGVPVGVWAGSELERPVTGKQKAEREQQRRAGKEGSVGGRGSEEENSLLKVAVTSCAGIGTTSRKARGSRHIDDEDPLSMSYSSIPDSMLRSAGGGSTGSTAMAPLGHSGGVHAPLLVRPSTAAVSRGHDPLMARVIEFHIQTNWGDEGLVGLTGISVLDNNFAEVPLSPPEVALIDTGASLGGGGSSMDCFMSSPAALVDGVNLTTDPANMWHVTHDPRRSTVVLRFELGATAIALRGLRVWNYNKPGEESCKGARHVQVLVDGINKLTLVLRKAPGESNIEYAQFVHLIGKERSALVGPQGGSPGDRKGSKSLSRSSSLSKMAPMGSRSSANLSFEFEGKGLVRTDSSGSGGGERIASHDSFDKAFPAVEGSADGLDGDVALLTVSGSASGSSTGRGKARSDGTSSSPSRTNKGQQSPVVATASGRLRDDLGLGVSAVGGGRDVVSWGGDGGSGVVGKVDDRIWCDVNQQYETSVSASHDMELEITAMMLCRQSREYYSN